MAEGGGLLNRCTSLNLYRGFESRTLRVFRLTQTFLRKDLGNVGCSYRLVRSTRLERVALLRITMIIIPPNLSYLSQNLFRLAVFFMDSVSSAAELRVPERMMCRSFKHTKTSSPILGIFQTFCYHRQTKTRRGGRVAEGARLESVFRVKLNEGSNPSLSEFPDPNSRKNFATIGLTCNTTLTKEIKYDKRRFKSTNN